MPVQPELPTNPFSHRVGAEEPWTFETTLRELIRSSPYIALALVVHVVLAFLLVFLQGSSPARPAEKDVAVAVSLEAPREMLPPPPPPPERQKVEELPEHTVEEPNVVENELVATVDKPDLVEVDSQLTEDSGEGTGKGTGEGSGFGSGFGAGRGNGFGNLEGDGSDSIGVGSGGGGGGGGGSGKLRGRRAAGKAGGEPVNHAVDDALMWLKNHQNEQGFWSCSAFDAECGKQGTDVVCDGTGSPEYDVGVTGLSLLAFLGANNTHKEGKYAKVVRTGLKYLVSIQAPDGNFGNESNGQYTYDHMIATLAMCEAYSLTKDHLFKAPVEKALAYLYKVRNPGAAWRYGPAYRPADEMQIHPNDMSVTGWAILVMTLAREYDLPLDKTALDNSMSFLEEMTDPVTGRTGYTERGQHPAREVGMEQIWPTDQTESITAVAVLCRIFADPKLERKGNREMVEKGIKLISALPPVWSDDQPGRRDFYFWYYGSYAMYQFGGAEWKAWEKTLVSAIAEHQHREGERKGSWDPKDDPWGSRGGRVYSTAILALCLEVFYRYSSVMGSH